MSNIVRLYTPREVDRLWNEYIALVHQHQRDARLLTNLAHMQACARAHARWSKAFLALDGGR